ncbi:MAG: TatD family hydrolase [Candidatus Omnitrophica bacterium]|nr:TatD family hydrolase [Candidatus Omnitrophota bacterium]MDD5553376.1 TatD family hydrolase [Candidatus Omnitrophota bacterium]
MTQNPRPSIPDPQIPLPELIDTHAHLDFADFDADLEEVISRAKAAGVNYIIDIGSSLEGSKRAVGLSSKYDFIYASVGIHPHEADRFDQAAKTDIEELARKDKVVAIGEAGLDYFKNYSRPENQTVLFKYMVGLAKDLRLPLVIHSRQAQEDTLKVLNAAKPLKAVVHCFSGDESFMKECLDAGFLISFTCNITYKKAEGLRSVLRSAPLERLMLETDAPFLPPEGSRGKRNEPAYVKILCQEVARVKEVPWQDVARLTTENARRFFNLK